MELKNVLTNDKLRFLSIKCFFIRDNKKNYRKSHFICTLRVKYKDSDVVQNRRSLSQTTETGKQSTQHGYLRLKKNGSSQGGQKQQQCKNFSR